MNAVQLLKQQHQDVRELFSLFEKAKDSVDQDRICQQLADNLAAHMVIEEQIFYPAAFSAMDDDDRLQEALAEHQEAKDILVEILDMDMSLGAKDFEQKMSLLQQKIEHHVQEEENDVFKRARAAMDRDELDRLGAEMKAMFTEQMSGEPTASLTGDVGDVSEEEESESESSRM